MTNYVVIFPGQGSQNKEMLNSYANVESFNSVINQASDILSYDIREITKDESKLNDTTFTQPVIVAVSVAMWNTWVDEKVSRPIFSAGHSLGEYSALVASGIISLNDVSTIGRLGLKTFLLYIISTIIAISIALFVSSLVEYNVSEIKNEEFQRLINNGEFLEYAKVFNNFYGTSKDYVFKMLKKGKDVLFDIDWQGTKKIKNKKLKFKILTIFVLPPSRDILFKRLSNRDMRDKLIVEERMKQFNKDILHWINYDYVVINNDLSECYNKITNLINAVLNNGSKDYDVNYIRNHVEKLTS